VGWLALVLLPPLVWLLRQAYAYRLRLEDERRTWHLFSEVATRLNRHNEPDAAAAGIEGALRLFPATAVEVVVGEGDGRRIYAVERDARAEDRRGDLGARSEKKCRHTHRLLASGSPIGELRMWVKHPSRCTRRDQLMLAAYGDALAAALHDAATHQELRAIVDRSTYESVHDPLTGMANRGALLARGNALLRQLDPGAPIALLLLDVNHFKEVNNTLGHEAGDELLQIIALRLGSAAHEDEILARLGGDEFALLLTRSSPAPSGDRSDDSPSSPFRDHAMDRARRIAERVAAPTEVCGIMLSVEAAVGLVADVSGDIDMTELLRRADIAMYRAKRGSGGVAWYEPGGDETNLDRLALLAELREALGVSDQRTVLLQPVVSRTTGLPVAAVARVRGRHPRRGLLEPEQFLAVVEDSELIAPFTRYVLETALETVAGWLVLGIDVPVSVNLSARSLLDRSLAADLPELLRQRGVPADHLILEIRESVIQAEPVVGEEVLAALRAGGIGLAVDDFGSGFSSLTFLSRVPVDELKVDGAFVNRMVVSPEAAAIVRTTVDLGKRLGLRVVAEGVENAAQRAALIELGCPFAQGYFFYRPLTAERATLALAESLGDAR
jgi:diguanylate cyclase (GGDEF)-like protein